MFHSRFKTILFGFTIIVFLSLTLGVGIAFGSLSFSDLKLKSLDQKNVLRPVEIYLAPHQLVKNQKIQSEELTILFPPERWRYRNVGEALLQGDFFKGDEADCRRKFKLSVFPEGGRCFAWIKAPATAEQHLVVLNSSDLVVEIFEGAQSIPQVLLESQLYAQFIGDEPILQKSFTLSEIPSYCPLAVMAIEDAQFLEHDGFSIKSIGRAFVKNLSSGRKAQGGSTITQQLVKNYFLSPERTLERKVKELAISLWIETKHTKDQILETYLNIIYMGQNGTYQVRGFSSASEYYFKKSVQNLSLSDCALLAAIINSPGMYNPFKNPEKATSRKNLVLKRMLELNLISKEEKQTAEAAALPAKRSQLAVETAPYYIQAVRAQVESLGLPWENLKIQTGLEIRLQAKAQKAIFNHLKYLEENNKLVKDLKAKGIELEAALLSADNKTGVIQAAIGGRDFRKTQFNRMTNSRRQAGSTVKPFVYLAALTEGDSADTIIQDEKVTITSGKKKWSPENYDRKFRGDITLKEALALSLNAATVNLSQKVGLEKVIQTMRQAGYQSEIPLYPSSVLGSFEVTPLESLNSYLTLARLGKTAETSFIYSIENLQGEILYSHGKQESEQRFNEEDVQELITMLEESIETGTGKAIRSAGYTGQVAGKTGTTNDYKDSWFIAFTPENTTLVWVGFDRNQSAKLTGASAALPIWLLFIN